MTNGQKEIDLQELYLKYTEDTEAPTVFHRWSFLAGISALIGRKCWLPFGEGRIFPNLYCMMIGNPGTRKSSAIKPVKKLLAEVGYRTFAFDRSSKEKFLEDLANDGYEDGNTETNSVMENLFGAEGQSPREVFIVQDEFNVFVGNGNIEFLSLLGTLWDWDDETLCFNQRFKNSKSLSIYQPTVTILGGNTHVGLAQAFPVETLGQGFMSRLLLVFSEPSGRKITFPKKPPEELRSQLLSRMAKIYTEFSGEFSFTKESELALDTIYRSFRGLEDIRFQHYSTRRFTHLLKLCMVVCACKLKLQIEVDDVVMANTLLSFIEHHMPKALGEFGKAKNSDVAGKIIAVLSESKTPVSLAKIWESVRTDLDKMEDMTKILSGLEAAKQIQHVNANRLEDRGFTVVRKILTERNQFIDYSRLKEAPDVFKTSGNVVSIKSL